MKRETNEPMKRETNEPMKRETNGGKEILVKFRSSFQEVSSLCGSLKFAEEIRVLSLSAAVRCRKGVPFLRTQLPISVQ